MKRLFSILVCLTMFLAPTACTLTQFKAETQKAVEISTPVVKGLWKAVTWAAPVANSIISMVGNDKEKAAMQVANASVSGLNTVVKVATETGDPAQLAASFSALQVAFNALDAAYQNKPSAAEQLESVPAAVDAAKSVVQ